MGGSILFLTSEIIFLIMFAWKEYCHAFFSMNVIFHTFSMVLLLMKLNN